MAFVDDFVVVVVDVIITTAFYCHTVKLFINEEKPHNIQEAIFRGRKTCPILDQSHDSLLLYTIIPFN